MSLDSILLSRFRNHGETVVEGTAQFNLLIGENGAGKTNILEAISLLAPGRGLRRAALADMPAQNGDGGFAISAALASGAGEPVRIGTGVQAQRPSRRIVHINGAQGSALALGEWLSIGWLTPAMDRLFVDGASGRRRFLDRLVLSLHPAHASHATRLDNALRERNRLLSDKRTPDPRWLDGIEMHIAESGALVAQARAELLSRMETQLAALPDAPFARPSLTYQAGGPLEASDLAQALRDARPRERAAGRTLVGPHRDDIGVTMAGKGQAAADCSTGEQKAMLIAITLAHSQLLETIASQGVSQGEPRPRLLLLDEVAAHLDPVRREALFARLRAGSAQIWLTGTELAPFEAIAHEAAIWEVNSGAVTRLS